MRMRMLPLAFCSTENNIYQTAFCSTEKIIYIKWMKRGYKYASMLDMLARATALQEARQAFPHYQFPYYQFRYQFSKGRPVPTWRSSLALSRAATWSALSRHPRAPAAPWACSYDFTPVPSKLMHEKHLTPSIAYHQVAQVVTLQSAGQGCQPLHCLALLSLLGA